MTLPDAKQLTALAKACRKAGITSFKSADFEFTLSEHAPDSRRKSRQTAIAAKPKPDLGENAIETDELSGDALLFWSTGEDPQPQDSA